MKSRIRGVTSALSLFVFSVVGALGAYVDNTPLVKVVTTPYGAVKEASVTMLPIITWGGDIATILANGNATNTAAGSIFAGQGFKFRLVKEDVFPKQLEGYIHGDSPYLRGTLGMLNQAAELLNKDPRLRPIIVYQLTWSTGGDVLVVKPSVKTGADLRGKTIAVQAYGPHADYLTTVLSDFGIKLNEVTVKWVKDITASADSPGEAFKKDPTVEAAFVISPDASVLTSNGTEGTGAEGSVKGSRVLLSTKVANKIIADVYAVRSDYFESHQTEVQKFVHALFLAEEALGQQFKDASKKGELDKTLTAAGAILLDNAKDTDGIKGLYGDCEYVGYTGNVKFFSDPNNLRGFRALNGNIQTTFIGLGLLSKQVPFADAGLNYEALKQGLIQTSATEAPRFQPEVVARIINQKAEQGTLGQGELYSFEILFEPNRSVFTPEMYEAEFQRVVELASTYGGAVITVEGHTDPMPYLKARSENRPELVLKGLRQSARNLSLNRAANVRDTIIEFAKRKNVSLDQSQFATVGHGINNPKTGLQGGEPKPPKTEQEWKSNMRVQFRLVGMEAEQAVFAPLGGGK